MKRLSYIDRVKGLLIISVVLGHAALSIGLMDYNYPYVCYPFNATAFLYVGIFMQAFFLVSGYVSNFHKDFKTFIIKNIQTIVVPLLTLGFAKQIFEGLLTADDSLFSMGGVRTFILNGPLWFLNALFLSRLIYWMVVHSVHNRYMRGAVMIAIMIGSIFINHHPNSFPSDYFYWQASLGLCVFLWIGDEMKQVRITDKRLLGMGIFYVFLLVLSRFLPVLSPIPYDAAKSTLTYWQIPIDVFYVLSGTALLGWISRKTGQNKFLEYYGKNSLVVYIFNVPVLCFSAFLTTLIISPAGKVKSMLYLLVYMALTFIIMTLVIFCCTKRPINILLGKR